MFDGDGNFHNIHWCQYDESGVLRTITEVGVSPCGNSPEEVRAEMALMYEQAISQPVIIERYKKDKSNPMRIYREFTVPPDGRCQKRLIRRVLMTEYNIQIGAPDYQTCAVIVNESEADKR